MSVRKFVVGIAASMIVGSTALVVAQEAAAPSPAAVEPTRVRLPRAYAQLTGLTDDQKSKILDIREKADKQIEAIRAQENDDMQAVLTDAQKEELKTVEAKLEDEARSRREKERLQEDIQSQQEKLDQLKDQGGSTPTTNPS